MKFIPGKLFFLCVLAITLVWLGGCEKLRVEPVSVEGQTIVGHWYAEQSIDDDGTLEQRHVYLQVREDGYARYFSLLCEKNLSSQVSNSRSLELDYTPIKRLNHQKMLLQRYPLTPQFELTIEHWPDQQNDQFEVDQVQLQRLPESDIPEYDAWNCDNFGSI